MKRCVVGLVLVWAALAQEPAAPPLRKGVSVQMAVAQHAVEVRAADEPAATVVAITAEGRVYSGVERTEPEALSRIPAETVYLKADARVPFQTLVSVLDALRGKSVVLLTASPSPTGGTKWLAPYGLKLTLIR